MSTENITDQATATAALNKHRDALAKAVKNSADTTSALRDAIVRIRPLGILSVGDMAGAIERDRNYIDSVWSAYGETEKGKQTRVPVQGDEYQASTLHGELSSLAHNQRGTAGTVGVLRAERDRVVAMIYASKILGPSAIAAAVGIDRNHVLRCARKLGVSPAWRPAGTAKNQHTVKAA